MLSVFLWVGALFTKAREKVVFPRRERRFLFAKKGAGDCGRQGTIALFTDKEEGSGWRSHL